MTRTRCAMAIVVAGILAASAPAQFVIGLPTIGQGGIAFSTKGSHLKISGFVPLGPPYPAVVPVTPTPFGFQQIAPAYLPYGYYGYPPIAPGFPLPGYGAIDQRITVQVVNPTVVVQGRRLAARQEPDLSGIDLDVESAEKIWGKKPQVAAAPPKKNGEAVKAPLPPKEKKQEVAAAPPKPAPPPPPKAEPVLEGDRFVLLGIAAFKNGEYGLAHFRFRQANDAEPPGKRALFLQAQASIAVGKFREAVQLIEKGLRHDRDWPTSTFRPKVELYNNLDAWNEHLIALEEHRKLHPDNGDYPFLLGYLEWFGGERGLAREHFLAARALAKDVRWCDLFLKAAK